MANKKNSNRWAALNAKMQSDDHEGLPACVDNIAHGIRELIRKEAPIDEPADVVLWTMVVKRAMHDVVMWEAAVAEARGVQVKELAEATGYNSGPGFRAAMPEVKEMAEKQRAADLAGVGIEHQLDWVRAWFEPEANQ